MSSRPAELLDRAGATNKLLPVDDICEPLDRALVARLRRTVAQATASLDRFEYAGALQITEEVFWEFCNDYLELVKIRSYQEEDTPGRRSAIATLQLALRSFLRRRGVAVHEENDREQSEKPRGRIDVGAEYPAELEAAQGGGHGREVRVQALVFTAESGEAFGTTAKTLSPLPTRR